MDISDIYILHIYIYIIYKNGMPLINWKADLIWQQIQEWHIWQFGLLHKIATLSVQGPWLALALTMTLLPSRSPVQGQRLRSMESKYSEIGRQCCKSYLNCKPNLSMASLLKFLISSYRNYLNCRHASLTTESQSHRRKFPIESEVKHPGSISSK